MKKLNFYILLFFCVVLVFAGCGKIPAEDTRNSTAEQQQETQSTQQIQPVQTDPPLLTLPEGTPLTAEELKWFNEEFFSGVWVDKDDVKWHYNIRNMYMQIEYASVEEIDMEYLFRNGVCPTKELVTQKEIDAIQQVTGKTVSGEVIKIPKWDMEIAYLHTSGKAFTSTPRYGLEKMVYLEEYDAYYNCLPSIESPSYEIIKGVKLQGGQIVVLQYQHKQPDVANDWIVTLRHHDGTYWFVSNLPCSG